MEEVRPAVEGLFSSEMVPCGCAMGSLLVRLGVRLGMEPGGQKRDQKWVHIAGPMRVCPGVRFNKKTIGDPHSGPIFGSMDNAGQKVQEMAQRIRFWIRFGAGFWCRTGG